jgi:hypothetical protein
MIFSQPLGALFRRLSSVSDEIMSLGSLASSPDIWGCVLSLLSSDDLRTCCCVSRAWREGDSQSVWEVLYKARWEQTPTTFTSWKEVYRYHLITAASVALLKHASHKDIPPHHHSDLIRKLYRTNTVDHNRRTPHFTLTTTSNAAITTRQHNCLKKRNLYNFCSILGANTALCAHLPPREM